MEEIWSLHTDYGNNKSGALELEDIHAYRRFLSDPMLPSRSQSPDSSDTYCPDCGMPAQSRDTATTTPRNDFNNNLNPPIPSSHFFSSITDDVNSILSFQSSSPQPDAELILLIQQLESERFDLIASEKRHSEKASSPTEITDNGWHSAVTSPVNRANCPEDSTEETSNDAFRISDCLFSSDTIKTKKSTASSRRRIRINQINLELEQLRRLQAMEERSIRHSSRSSKATRSVSTATTPGGSVTSKDGATEAAAFSGDGRPLMNTMQPDLLLATMSTLFDVDKKKMTEVLERQCMSRDQCFLLYQQNVIPIVVRLIHDPMCGISNSPADVRVSAGRILFQLVSCQADDKRGRREGRVLHWLEDVRAYNTAIIHPHSRTDRHVDEEESDILPCSALQNLRKNSSDEEFRHAICFLGGLNAVAEFLQCDFAKFDNTSNIRHATMRQYACIILTNLSFGDGCNKALLCSSQSFLDTLVHLLTSPNEDLRLNVASVIRNISWRADVTSKRSLRNSKVVTSLLRAAMQSKSENSLEVLLSALSNLSAHNDENRQEICAFEGALLFLLRHLQYGSASHSADHKVEEYSGSVLRSISSVIAVRPEYRRVLRENRGLEILVEHLRSSCIVLVFNACGILWNLSARCVEDQQRLWELQAVPLLETLSRSTHEGIAGASAKAVKNLRKAREGLHGSSGGKTTTTTGDRGNGMSSNNSKSRRGKSTGHRSGRNDDPIHSADDMADDYHFDQGVEPYRLVRNTSVPSSPLISARSARSNGSHRSATNMSNLDRLGDRRDRAVQLMASISRQVSGDTSRGHLTEHQPRPQPNTLSSPPLSPLKQQNNEAPPVFQHFNHDHQQSQRFLENEGNSWQNFHHFQFSKCPPQPTFQDFPPFDFPGNNVDATDKIMEEETSDECIDFGTRDSQPDTHHVELQASEDTVQQYNTEGTPYLSRVTSPTNNGTFNRHNIVSGAFPVSPKEVSLVETSLMMMTPMACSRSSTPDHLSDVETSMGDDVLDKQSVYSQFSRAPSGLATPSFSEIPGSPSLMPRQMPKRRILPAPPVQRDVVVLVAPPTSNGANVEEEPDDVLADVISKGNNLSLRRRSKKSGILQLAPPSGTKKAPSGGLAPTFQSALQPPLLSKAPPVGSVGAFQSASQAPPVGFLQSSPAGISFTVPTTGYGEFDGFPEDTVRTYATEGGLSNATSLSSLPLSAMSGLPFLTNKSKTLERSPPSTKPNKTLPPLPPKPSGLSFSKNTLQNVLVPETHTISTSVEESGLVEPKSFLSVEKDQAPTAQVSDRFTFKWPIPPHEAPPLPRRVSSLPPSLRIKKINPILSRSMPESLICLQEGIVSGQPAAPPVTSSVSESVTLPVAPFESESAAPPLPPPFTETSVEKLSPDDMGGDLLADIIYGVLPRKSMTKKKKVGKGSAKADSKRPISDRKTSIQNGLANTATLSMSHSLSVPRSEVGTPQAPRSRSSHFLGGESSTAHSEGTSTILPPPTSVAARGGLSLSLAQRALPACPDQKQGNGGGTSMWIDLNSGTATSLQMAPPVKMAPVVKGAPLVVDWLSDSGSGSDVESRPTGHTSGKKKHITKPIARVPSPDVFDTISQMDSVLESHFTSEASDGDAGETHDGPKRPRIVKPKPALDGNVHKKQNGNDFELKSPKPIRGGTKKPQNFGHNGQTGSSSTKSLNFGRSASTGLSSSLSTTIQSDDSQLPPHHGVLLKQGTFTKEGGPTALATPWVFPDSDISKQSVSLRQRYASVTRAPRESCSSASSVDSPRMKAPGPRSRSARSISRPAVPLTTVSGNQVICVESISNNKKSNSPKIQRKKVPVTSKIAFLWRGDKKSSIEKAEKVEKEMKNGVKTEGVPSVEASSSSSNKVTESIAAGQFSVGLKSPTLSERLKPSRSLLSMAPRMTSTLPKKMRTPTNSSGGGGGGGGVDDQNGQESNKNAKKGSLTVTSV